MEAAPVLASLAWTGRPAAMVDAAGVAARPWGAGVFPPSAERIMIAVVLRGCGVAAGRPAVRDQDVGWKLSDAIRAPVITACRRQDAHSTRYGRLARSRGRSQKASV
jgi:hypothetical protein